MDGSTRLLLSPSKLVRVATVSPEPRPLYPPTLPHVAQQEAQRAQFVVERAKQERQEKVVRAEGEAEAASMISFLVDDESVPF